MQEESSYLHIQSSNSEAAFMPWTLRPTSQTLSLHLSDSVPGRDTLLIHIARSPKQCTENLYASNSHCLPRPFQVGFLCLKGVFAIALLQIGVP